MFKFGIYKLDQLLKDPDPRDLFRRRRNIAISLYDELADLPDSDALADRILLLFPDERGAFKRTYSNRFEDFDGAVVRVMRASFEGEQAPALLDIGVSDARTSCDFFHLLSADFRQVEYLATDFDPEIRILESGSLKIATNRSSKILQVIWPPFVFNHVKSEGKLYWLNHVAEYIIRRCLVKRVMASGQEPVHRTISTFSPKARRLSAQDGRFRLGRRNILEPSADAGKYHVIRAMNVLNAEYFQPVSMRIVLANIHKELKPHGLFVTGSNQEAASVVHGGVYQKTPEGFIPIWQSGNGSVMDPLIRDYRA